MTVLSVVQSFATKVGIEVPTSLFAQADRTSLEVKETANECARIVADAADWGILKKIATITGDGVTESYPLSTMVTDYRRMLKKGNLWLDPNPNLPFMQFNDVDEWLGLEVGTYTPFYGGWIIYGGELHIRQGGSLNGLDDGAIVKFPYISKNIVRASNGTLKDSFTADTDTFLLDERLLKLCMIWSYRASKMQPYGQEMDDYETALAIERGADRGPRVLVGPSRGLGFDPYGPYRNVWP